MSVVINSIQELNIYLSNNLTNLKLNDYFKEIQHRFYNDLDISFMEYFLELCNHENEFIVEHKKLKEYGVLNNINTSAKIKRTLDDTLFLIENEDYWVSNVGQPLTGRRGGATSGYNQYKLTPYAFKLCLIRSKNSKKYAKYYLLLEQVFKNYQDYQILYQNNIINGISSENKSLHEKLDKQSEEIKKQSEEIKELLGYAKESKAQNEELHDKVDDLNDTMEDIKEAFKDTSEKSVPDPKNNNEKHEFILLQNKELMNHFKFIRGIQKLNDKQIHKKYNEEYNIIKRNYHANPIQLYKQFKEEMKDRFKTEKEKIKSSNVKNKTELKKQVDKIKFRGINLELLNDYTLNKLLDDLTEVYNEKFKNYNEFENETP
jgi:gas vesicle protein